jgi:hypothetical protein
VTSNPAGITCEPTCQASFNHNALVKLTGSPAAGSKAVVWESCPGTVNASNQCEVTISEARNVVASFDFLGQFQLRVTKNGSGSGTVTSNPAGINCGTTECQASFNEGALVKLSGTPTAGSKAVVWQSCPGTVNASNQCEVTISEAKEAIATFDLEQHVLTVTKNGSGTGTVTSNPAGISCGSGAECHASFNHNALVKLTGSPAAGSKAVAWSGCDSVNGANECEVTISQAKSVEATFDLETHQLSVTENGTGSGTVTSNPAGIDCGDECSAEYAHGSEVTLSAIADLPGGSIAWSGCSSNPAPEQCTVTMNAARAVTATFGAAKGKLSIAKLGAGLGYVASAPAGIGCGGTCKASFDLGSVVTLSATSGPDTAEVVWSGCDSVPTADRCKVTIGAETLITASFASTAVPVQLSDEVPPVTEEGEEDPLPKRKAKSKRKALARCRKLKGSARARCVRKAKAQGSSGKKRHEKSRRRHRGGRR